ncbi:MAG: DUF2950 domain-containing protein [Verrucomicrobiota bacterium]
MKTNLILILSIGAAMNCVAGEAPAPVSMGREFESPQAAVAALQSAMDSKSGEALRTIFGPAIRDLENPDRVQATNEFNTFAAALSETNALDWRSSSNVVLELGRDLWPFPIPLVRLGDQWHFDTEAGKEELLNRRIGQNELQTIEVMRQYVQAQKEYSAEDHKGNDVLEFAQRLRSRPGLKDGLYWPPDLDGEISPFGPLAANAQAEGYETQPQGIHPGAEPFHGYFFRILTRQGKHAPGGKYDYIINGHMIAGFALVAWPAEWGQSGIMTFIVNQQGRVYQKDLGKETTKAVRKIKAYDPDSTWTLCPD